MLKAIKISLLPSQDNTRPHAPRTAWKYYINIDNVVAITQPQLPCWNPSAITCYDQRLRRFAEGILSYNIPQLYAEFQQRYKRSTFIINNDSST